MSRAFINEDKQADIPFVPPRADLPRGVSNYVTPNGLDALLKEKEDLLAELKEWNKGDEHGKLTAIKVLNIKLQRLENRIVTAQVINPEEQDKSEVRFGSTVLLQMGKGKNKRKLQIVGVDEADLKEGKIAFISPLGKLLMNKKVGETATLKLENGNREFKVLEIE
ncbi:MAG TPA: GreA/GreB family elongation factor [Dysgonamonadaceae bacterium]|nr:GreA/GreB family elongation factor [Dysgonamonadaceae bacterium]